jgi:hypothetical protein
MRYYRHYIKYVPQIGYKVPLVPRSDVENVLDPFEARCPDGDLGKSCRQLINILKECGCSVGITGSLLGGYWSSSSDIDLICLGSERTYLQMIQLRNNGVLKPLIKDLFITEYYEVSESLDFEAHSKLASSKISQGLFNDRKYTIKFIDCSRASILNMQRQILPARDILVEVLKGDFRIPAIYSIRIIKPSYLGAYKAIMYSFRTRFTELGSGSILRMYTSIEFTQDNTILVPIDRSISVSIINLNPFINESVSDIHKVSEYVTVSSKYLLP